MPDDVIIGTPGEPSTLNDELNLLAEGEPEEVIKPEEVDEEPTPEEDSTPEEDAKPESEEKEVDAIDSAASTESTRGSLKDVKDKYPELFKDFPWLKDSFYRENEYTHIFPTVDEAKQAVEDLSTLNTLRDKTLDGDFGTVLSTVKDTDEGAYTKLVDNLLPQLYKTDNDAYLRAVTPLLENVVRNAYREGMSTNNEDLQNSALHISKFLLGTEDVATGKVTTIKVKPSETEDGKKLSSEREQFHKEMYMSALGEVSSNVEDNLRATILKDLDPSDELTPYMRDTVVKDVIKQVMDGLGKDQSHMALMNAKWKKAKLERYSKDSKQAITSAVLARAKSMIPSVRAKVKTAALGPSKKVVNTEEQRREIPSGRAPSGKSESLSPKRIDWKKMSDEDVMAL